MPSSDNPHSGDIARISAQEEKLVFSSFDETVAFALGLKIKELVEARNLSVGIDVRTWDRQLFFYAMPTTVADNQEWIRRKVNSVRRYQRASYRLMLERGGEEVLRPHWGLDAREYVFAGGCFPIRVQGAGCIGAVTVSGLPGRDDHAVVVEALCALIGVNYSELALA